MTDPLQWTPRDGARAWSRIVRGGLPREAIIDDPVAFRLFHVGSSALLAYQRAVDDLSDRWLERAEKLEAGGNIHLREESAHLRRLAQEMRTAVSGARLPHAPRGQRASAAAAADEHTRLSEELGE